MRPDSSPALQPGAGVEWAQATGLVGFLFSLGPSSLHPFPLPQFLSLKKK